MTGLGETCSHVATLLWAIESGVRHRNSLTVTQRKAYWVIPNAVKTVTYAPVREISFIRKKRSQSILSSSSSSSVSRLPSFSSVSSSTNNCPTLPTAQPCSSSGSSRTGQVSRPTDEDIDSFLNSLGELSTKPAILSLVDPYSDSYVPKSVSKQLSVCLLNLLKPEYLQYSYGDLLQVAKSCRFTVTAEEIEAVESEMRS